MTTVFRPRDLVVLVATLLCLSAAVRLGLWQLDRAKQKEALQSIQEERGSLSPVSAAELAQTPEEAPAQHHRPVRLQGRWLSDHTVFLENRQMKGRPGFLVVTPLQLESGRDAVLVQRGWTPRDFQDRARLPRVPTPVGTVELNGVIAPLPSRLYEFGAEAGGPIRQNLDVAEFTREIGVPLRPVSVLLGDAPEMASDGLLRDWPLPAVDVHKHYGYAFQWFALGALMAGLYVWFQLVRPSLHRRA